MSKEMVQVTRSPSLFRVGKREPFSRGKTKLFMLSIFEKIDI